MVDPHSRQPGRSGSGLRQPVQEPRTLQLPLTDIHQAASCVGSPAGAVTGRLGAALGKAFPGCLTVLRGHV
jgi:hypothetical protein